MPVPEFERWAHEVVDWIASYLSGIETYPVTPTLEPGDLKSSLPARPPDEGEDFGAILTDFRERIIPAVTHWNHPGFLGYFAITGSGPGILGEMLAAALNVNAMVWQSCPAGVELEQLATDWLRDLIGLPEPFEGVINDTASSSTLYALAAAREQAVPEASEAGLAEGPRCRVYASEEAHSSVEKAVMTLGLGRAATARVETDSGFGMEPSELDGAIVEDREAGIRPVAVVATVGTTSTGSVDPVDAIADIARRHGIWLHVDAAYAGPAASLPELRPLFSGWERADSVVVNPHKWLFTPVDCSVLFCRRPELLRAAFELTPASLETPAEGAVWNPMDHGVALGRRFRALKLWFVLRYFGVQGVRARIRAHVTMAAHLRDWVRGEPGWLLVREPLFSTVVFRYAPGDESPEASDEMNEEILERVNRSGEVFLTRTRLEGRIVLRVSVGNLRTNLTHVRRAWELLRDAAVEFQLGR